jgi:hypothetical protein
MRSVSVWGFTDVEPPSVVETRGVDHQRVLLPVPNQYPNQWDWDLGKLAAIGEDGSMRTVRRLVEDHDEPRSLDDLTSSKLRNGMLTGSARELVASEVLDALQTQGLGPG